VRADGPRSWDLTSHEKLYSQANEELIVRHFFGDREAGTFVDVGCYHWKQFSTTYYLEAHLGWSGIGIDALPSLRAGYEKNRKRTRFFNYLVGDESGGVATLFAAGPLSSTDEARIEAWGQEGKPIEVPRITLNDLLDAAGVEKIDFLSMDIEQAEPAALAGFDIERFRPELVCIEATESVREPIAAYFDAHGYERIDAYLSYDPVNWYYRPRPPTWPVTAASGAVAVILGAGLVFALQRRAGSRTAEEPV
jgi:FkbM family methyltransferase